MKTFCAHCRWILLFRDLGHFILTRVSFLENIIAPNLMGLICNLEFIRNV